MKRVFYALTFCAALLLISTTVFAAEPNNTADSIEYYTFAEIFPDANFREYVTDTVLADSTDSKADDAALTAEQLDRISTYSWVNVSSREIKSLDGIEWFTGLKELDCYNNQLTSLDVSNNPLLEYLHCGNNHLTTLNVNSNPLLKTLWCGGNQLTALDVSNHPKLIRLDCNGVYIADKDGNMVNTSQLSTLNASNNPSLEFLWCSDNRLTTLNVSNAPALTELHCQGNKLTALDISTSPALTELWCYNNYLSTVNVSNNPMIVSY